VWSSVRNKLVGEWMGWRKCSYSRILDGLSEVWAKPGLLSTTTMSTRFFFFPDGGTGKVRPNSLPDVVFRACVRARRWEDLRFAKREVWDVGCDTT